MFETIIGILAGVLTSASMLPQLVKVIREKDVEGLSPVTLGVLIAGVILWTWYGVRQEELPIALSNGFAVIINSALLIFFFLYRNRR